MEEEGILLEGEGSTGGMGLPLEAEGILLEERGFPW